MGSGSRRPDAQRGVARPIRRQSAGRHRAIEGKPQRLLFTEPAVGQAHGYYDGWWGDDCFHYTGEGQRGDQELVRGNLAILRHREEARALRLFRGAGGRVTYLGEFELDNNPPYYRTDATETGGGPLRQVLVFRLRPLAQ